MKDIRGHDYLLNQSWIEFKAPNAQGVYCLRDKEGKVIFVGKGNVRERLLSHWNHGSSTDAEIWSYAPATFRFELNNHPAEREAELIRELKPACNPLHHSHFPRFW
jgi:excinuclease UvrABC nuclease subunit